MEGLVIRATGSWYTVKTSDGKKIECRLKGKFRLTEKGDTNPVVVGDKVKIAISEKDGHVIDKIFERKNYIVRLASRHKYMRHVIAANLDLALLIVTVARPRTSTGFMDRFLAVAQYYEVPVQLVFNKTDSLNSKEQQLQNILIERYQNCGYACSAVSAITGEGMEMLKSKLNNKATLLSGHSGVGKSTVINFIHPELNIKTSEISRQTGKGKHTTTFAEMHELPFGGYIIDTPGIKEFALPPDLETENLAYLFPEMAKIAGDCKFNNCHHLNEPKCKVIEAVKNEEINHYRYQSYKAMLAELEGRKGY